MKHLFFLSIILSVIACKEQSYNCSKECNTTEELVFQTGFTNTQISSITKDWYALTGTDSSISEPNSWEAFQNHESIGDIKINCGNGDETQRWAKIVKDPENELNDVLTYRIIEPNDKEPGKKKGRVQLDINRNNCIKQYTQSVRLYLHSDMQELENWNESFYWLSLFEFWNNANWTNEKYPFRVTINIAKPEKGIGKPLYFHAKADKYKGLGRWEVVWEQLSNTMEVPFGEWIDIELSITEGDSKTGRFIMKATLHNEQEKILFDVTNYTQHPKETCPDGFSEIHPLKFYTSEELVNFMKQNDKHLQIYWDDWKVWRNK